MSALLRRAQELLSCGWKSTAQEHWSRTTAHCWFWGPSVTPRCSTGRLRVFCSSSAAQQLRENLNSLGRSSLSSDSSSHCDPIALNCSKGTVPAWRAPRALGQLNPQSREHPVPCSSSQCNAPGCDRAFSCWKQPLPGELTLPCPSVTSPDCTGTGTPLLAPRDTARRAQWHSLKGQARSHRPWRLHQHCWGWVLPFPVDGGHPRSSHHHRGPSCKERVTR